MRLFTLLTALVLALAAGPAHAAPLPLALHPGPALRPADPTRRSVGTSLGGDILAEAESALGGKAASGSGSGLLAKLKGFRLSGSAAKAVTVPEDLVDGASAKAATKAPKAPKAPKAAKAASKAKTAPIKAKPAKAPVAGAEAPTADALVPPLAPATVTQQAIEAAYAGETPEVQAGIERYLMRKPSTFTGTMVNADGSLTAQGTKELDFLINALKAMPP